MSLKNLAKLISNATKELTPEQEFLNALNEAIVKEEVKTRRQPTKSFKPSSIAGCHRMMYFTLIGAPIDKNFDADPQFIGMGQSGTARHEYLQTTISQMKENGFDVEWIEIEDYLKIRPQKGLEIISKQGLETKLFSRKYNLRFLCDGIIKVNGVYFILEIKTEVSFKWQSRTEADRKHIPQASSYSLCLGINRVLFLYENRDLCSKKAFIVEVSDDDRKGVVKTIRKVNNSKRLKQVPPKSEDKYDCRFCDFKDECKKW